MCDAGRVGQAEEVSQLTGGEAGVLGSFAQVHHRPGETLLGHLSLEDTLLDGAYTDTTHEKISLVHCENKGHTLCKIHFTMNDAGMIFSNYNTCLYLVGKLEKVHSVLCSLVPHLKLCELQHMVLEGPFHDVPKGAENDVQIQSHTDSKQIICSDLQLGDDRCEQFSSGRLSTREP